MNQGQFLCCKFAKNNDLQFTIIGLDSYILNSFSYLSPIKIYFLLLYDFFAEIRNYSFFASSFRVTEED